MLQHSGDKKAGSLQLIVENHLTCLSTPLPSLRHNLARFADTIGHWAISQMNFCFILFEAGEFGR